MLNGFGKLALELGRFPEASEYEPLAAVCDRLGSAKRALRAFVQGGGAEGVSWDEVRVRFGIGQPLRRRWEVLYEQHRELLDHFWRLMLQLGRLPEPEEFPQTGELREKIGSPKQALRMFVQKGGAEDVRRASENRKRDLLVYIALANLRKRVPFGHLSLSLRSDKRRSRRTRSITRMMGKPLAFGCVRRKFINCQIAMPRVLSLKLADLAMRPTIRVRSSKTIARTSQGEDVASNPANAAANAFKAALPSSGRSGTASL